MEESNESANIYCPEGYVAVAEEPEDGVDSEHEEYINSGYMTLPDEDPDEDTRTLLYPENYRGGCWYEILSTPLSVDRQLAILEQQYLAVVNGSAAEIDGSGTYGN